MTIRNKEWRNDIHDLLVKAGVQKIEQTFTGGSHLRYRGVIRTRWGEKPINLVCSNTPKDRLAIHRVRGDIRRLVTEASEKKQ